MDSGMIAKAMKIGNKLIELTIEDGKERRLFFTKDAESEIVVGSGKCLRFSDLPKAHQKILLKFHDEHKNDDFLSDMHSHPFDATFSTCDLPSIKRNLEGDINYSLVVTPQFLFVLYIPPNLKYDLKLSKGLLINLAGIDKRLWKKLGVDKFGQIRLKGSKIGNLPICNNKQRKQHNILWNRAFLEFFNRWNTTNKNLLEYEIHKLS